MFKDLIEKNKKVLLSGDNLDMLKKLNDDGCKEIIDLCYIDPPYNSKRNYNIAFKDAVSETPEEAFKDTWSNIKYLDELNQINSINPKLYNFLKLLEESVPGSHISYLTSMAIRCFYIREMLKDTGSFYYHCDPTMSHYVKIVLDYIFGEKNFRNEIVWCYSGANNGSKEFPKKHDIILSYGKNKDKTFFDGSRVLVESRSTAVYYTDSEGKQYTKKGGKIYYRKNQEGKIPEDYWVDINMLHHISNERLGYPTQKPEALLERIILASSNPGDTVADFFLGGGTSISVAERLGRNWIGCDLNHRAIQITNERLKKQNPDIQIKKDYVIYGIPKTAKELRDMIDSNDIGTAKNSRFALEDIVVKYYLNNVIGNDKKTGDGSIDGRFGFTYDNVPRRGLVQVTCGSNINHFKSFAHEIACGNGDMGVYIAFQNCITDGMVKIAKSEGQLGNVDKLQILTLEDLIDNKKYFQLP